MQKTIIMLMLLLDQAHRQPMSFVSDLVPAGSMLLTPGADSLSLPCQFSFYCISDNQAATINI